MKQYINPITADRFIKGFSIWTVDVNGDTLFTNSDVKTYTKMGKQLPVGECGVQTEPLRKVNKG